MYNTYSFWQNITFGKRVGVGIYFSSFHTNIHHFHPYKPPHRITETIPVFAYNSIIDSDLIYKDRSEEIRIAKSIVLNFYKSQLGKKDWYNFCLKVPVDSIAVLADTNYVMDYGTASYLQDDINRETFYYENLLTEINGISSKLIFSDYGNILRKANSKLSSFFDDMLILKNDSKPVKIFLIIRSYITLLPLLKQLKIFYHHSFFHAYILLIINQHNNLTPKELATHSYAFINTFLHSECINKDIFFKEMLFYNFQHLKDLKNILGLRLLSYERIQELFKFIVYLRTYSKLFSRNLISFYDNEILIDDLWTIYHYRETKKYFHKFFGNKADFNSYKLLYLSHKRINP